MKFWRDVYTAAIRAGKSSGDAKNNARSAIEMHDYYASVLEARAGKGEG